MKYLLKLLLAVSVIILCTQIGKKYPTLSGLIATMPLTGLIILIWLYHDNPGGSRMIIDYTRGALFGIFPTILFFLTALICFKKQLAIGPAVLISFCVWFCGAIIHQWLIR